MNSFKDLDPILHAQLRLAVMSLLVKERNSDFISVKNATSATAGNLSVQLKKLEEAGYVTITKSFSNNYPLTMIEVTAKGLNAFEKYVEALKSYF
ncbi:MAG: transcriptional regulator [Bacteroidia bacterium]|nr:transcriptional regulator [Bacteroidales bacterium]NCD43420.1 transcriptional regulator [Bacteroidia bacterium]MDD2322646.1 transcriptional regulator [Bacteroidales bacterium]MDD3011166.1 transcriptional regulator [Bacteroidales bacterium]MDD3961819.1 transcriptional regulator [Bacteroidales bacterium]